MLQDFLMWVISLAKFAVLSDNIRLTLGNPCDLTTLLPDFQNKSVTLPIPFTVSKRANEDCPIVDIDLYAFPLSGDVDKSCIPKD